ncbi:MAG: stage V sporulation protein AD [Ruminococcaceae bacterium]|nr:stage V sporulation protein AD [Oscillospiraceae bacterium]
MPQRTGKYTIELKNTPSIIGYAAVVGKKEAEGPLGQYFDKAYNDAFFGEKTFEKAETKMQKMTIETAVKKSELSKNDIQIAFAGDLLNQCIGSSFDMRDLGFCFAGLYGACSTMALSLALAGIFVDSGAAKTALAAASSHFCSAERQYRFPLEYGGQRSPASQWTVTGAGAAVVAEKRENTPKIEKVIIGSVRDLGITDVNNMGAAMAPAAAQTIGDFLKDTQTKPEDYDLILTGDLGSTGSALLEELMRKEYCTDISAVHKDCGTMVFDLEKQDVHSGGSGCGCSASVVCSYILGRLKSKELNKVLFVGTGALLSPTSSMQKESTPGIAHGVVLTA